MSILKYRTADGSIMPVGVPPGIIDWKNIINKPMLIGNSELSTDVDVVTLDSSAQASATLILNKETNQFELTLFIPKGKDGAGGSGGDGTGTGADGYSPTIQVKEITGGYAITVVNKDGPETFNLYNGVSPYQIASEHGYDGEESDFNKLLGSLGTLNYVLSSDIIDEITDSEDTKDKIPTAEAIISYVSDYLSKEYIVLQAELTIEESLAEEDTEVTGETIDEENENSAEVETYMYLTLDTKNLNLFELAITLEKPVYLNIANTDLILYYIGNRIFWSVLGEDFITVCFENNTAKARVNTTKYLSSSNVAKRVDSENDQYLPTVGAIIDYVEKHVTNNVNAELNLPLTSKALITFLEDNPEIILLKSTIVSEDDNKIVYLENEDKETFLANKDQLKLMYLYLSEDGLYFQYVGNDNFISFLGGQFSIIHFNISDVSEMLTEGDEEPVEPILEVKGTLATSNYLSETHVINDMAAEGAISSNLIPSTQALQAYLAAQITSKITSDNPDDLSALPTSQAVINYLESKEKLVIIEASKTVEEESDNTNKIYLTITAEDFSLISNSSALGKAIILQTNDRSITLMHIANSTFFGMFENDLVVVSFLSNNLTAQLNFLTILTQDYLATSVEASDNTIPTLKVLKEYVDAYGDITIPNATQDSDGLLSSQDKTKLDGIAENANNYVHPSSHPISFISGLSTALGSLSSSINEVEDELDNLNTTKISTNQVGVPLGIASLDSTGKVPAAQLPAVITDNIREGYYNSADKLFYEDNIFSIPIEGVLGNFYVDTITGEMYRYSGTMYVSQSNEAMKNIRALTTDELNEIINLRAEGGL